MPGEDGDQPLPGGPGQEAGSQEAEGGDSPSAEDTVALGEGPPAAQQEAEDVDRVLLPEGRLDAATGGGQLPL